MEEKDLSEEEPEMLRSLWALLNETNLGNYESRSPAKLLGRCDEACAKKKWNKGAAKKGKGKKNMNPGPICGVRGC